MSIYLNRQLSEEIVRVSAHYPILTVTGPRQSGKTTLCKQLYPNYTYVNLEDLSLRELVSANPKAFLQQYKDGVILDEVQTMPELFSYLQVVSDANPEHKYVLTGSSQLTLMQSVTQSLAGRTALFTLLPLSLSELGEKKSTPTDTLILNGSYPAIWGRGMPVQDFAKNYYQTYIERDVRQLIKIKELSKFQTFIRLCAGRIGTELNASSLANAVGVSSVTINEWLSVLETAYIVFRLPPFHKNIGKRLVKKSKLYFYDTALACFLLNIENESQLASHPLRGELFENMVVLEFYKARYNAGKAPNTYFYRDQSQREIDLLCAEGNGYHAYEIKSATAFHRSFTKNFDYLRKVLGEQVLSTTVLYDGEQVIESVDNGVRNFRS